MNISCIKLDSNHQKSLNKSFKNNLNINHLQTYFPILSIYFNFHNNSYSHKCFTFKSRYTLNKIVSPISIDNNMKDGYIKFPFNAIIKDNIKNIHIETATFIKLNPILDVIPYIINDYNIIHHKALPNIFNYLANKKINSYNNSAYIDSFFTFLGSQLLEENLCPTFPHFYGTFSGISNKYDFDITEEYSSIKNTDWYSIYNNSLFKIVKVENEYFSDTSSENIFSKNELDSINDLNQSDCTSNDSDKDSKNNLELSELDAELDNDFDNELEDNELEDNEVGDNELGDNELGDNELGDNELGGNELEDNEVGDNELEDNEVGDNELGDNELGDNELEDNELGGNELEDNELDSDSDQDDLRNIIFDKLECKSINSSLSNISDSSPDFKFLKYARLNNFPVQLCCMELLDKTLDEVIDDKSYNISDIEWTSILFQICFGLSVAQKKFNFVHNDLHSSNIMFKNTQLEYLYFHINNRYYKIPTFGKTTKIIDFGRATFNVGSKLYFSDVFKKNGDAEGQYSYPYHNHVNKNKVKTNKSFDLARLSTTIVQHFEEDTELFNLIKDWSTDRYGNCLIYHSDNFELYRKIAKDVNGSIPKNQLKKDIFTKFVIEQTDIPDKQHIFKY